MSATLLYVNVSYGCNEKNEIYVLTHIKSEDKSWCVNIKYKSLQDLDIKIEYYCKYIRHIAFPLIDKKIVSYFSNNINENQNNLPPWKQMFIYDCYSKELQDYIHVLLQYQHIYPPDIKYMIRKMFLLPCGDFHDVKLENELKDDTVLNEINDESNNNIKPSTSNFSKITKALTNITRRHSALTINNVNSLTNSNDDTNGDNKSYLSKAINKFHKNKNKQQPNKLLGIINSEKLITDLTIKEKSLLVVTVSRGIKGRQNQIEYEIKLECETYEADSQPVELTIRRKYDDFRKLYKLLYSNNVKSIDSTDIKSLDDVSNKTDSSLDSFDNEIIADRENTIFILSHFPNPPMIAMLGLKLSEKDLQYRTKLLDRWTREILSKYYLMNNQSRQIIRDFFNFDLSEDSQDIIIQDKLLQGLLVKQRAEARLHIPLYLLKNSDTEKWEKSSQLSGHSASLPVNNHNDNWNKYREDDSKSEASAYSSYSSYSNTSTASKQSKIPNGTISVTLSNRITAAPINRNTNTNTNTNTNANNNSNNNININNNYNNSGYNLSNRSMSISSEAPKEQSIFNESMIADENDSDIGTFLSFHADSNIKSTHSVIDEIFIIKVINAKYYCSPSHFINPSAVTPNKDINMNIWDKMTFLHTSYSQWPNNYINIKDIFDEKTLITIEDNKATLTRTFSNDNIDNYISNQKSNRTTSSSSNQPRRHSYSRSENGSPKPNRKKSNDVKKKASPAQSVVSSASATSTRIGRPGHTVDRNGLLNIGM